MSLRITGGEFRGRLVATPEGGATRPTASRVREAVFSMLGPLHGARVLDLCCGGGTLAYEALSRGAQDAVLIDAHAPAIMCARENAATYGVEERVRIIESDVVVGAVRLVDEDEQFDVIFLDAPYSQAPRVASRLDDTVRALLAPGGRVVLEGDRRDPPRLSLSLDREREYRDVLVQILELPDEASEAHEGAGA
jgi:16S rRNA (guanine966-N2)-methyltransferase